MAGLAVALARAVEAAIGGTGWSVAPLAGSSGRTFVAAGPQTVVVRLTTSPDILEHLGRTGVAPRTIARGAVDGRPFVVQEHVASPRLDGAWIAAHPEPVACLLRAVGRDEELAAMAEPLTPQSFVGMLGRAAGPNAPAGVGDIVRELAATVDSLDPAPLVASHGDPNASNFLVSPDGLRLIDWDDLRRADPLRDLGQVAWWYLQEADWPAFMGTAGVAWDDGAARRLAWWVAAESVDVAVRLWAADPGAASAFVRDAEAAIGGRPNPRRG